MFNKNYVSIPLTCEIVEYREGREYQGEIKINDCEFSFKLVFLYNVKNAPINFLSTVLSSKIELSSYLMEIKVGDGEALLTADDKVYIARFLASFAGHFQVDRSYLGPKASRPVSDRFKEEKYHPKELAVVLNKKPFECRIEL